MARMPWTSYLKSHLGSSATVRTRKVKAMFPQMRKDSRSGLQKSIELQNMNRMRSYGTLPSEEDPQETALLPQPEDVQKRVNARRGPHHKGYGALFAFIFLVLVGFFASPWTTTDTPAAVPPSIPPPNHSGQELQYVWLVEHDTDAYDQSLATSRSLYAIDIFLTNTSNGMFSVKAFPLP